MTTAIASVPQTQEQFEEAMMARMRAIMGELMPQATLAQITKRGVEEAFFKPRFEKDDGYGRKTFKEPWINEFLQKELAREVKEQIAAWAAANAETIKAEVAKTLAAGVMGCVMQYFASVFQEPMRNLANQINDRLQKLGQNGVYF